MIRRFLIVLAACLACVSASGAGSRAWAKAEQGPTDAQREPAEPQSRPAVVPLDSNLVFIPLDERSVLTQRFQQNTARPLSAYLSVSADRFYGFERYELSKVECALHGADVGLTLGLIAGALGMTAGLWDERTSWYIAGAAAALGTLHGVSRADDPGFRIRLRWDDTNRDPLSR